MKLHIILENSSGCELDCKPVPSEDQLNDALVAAATEWTLSAGDVIRIVEAA